MKKIKYLIYLIVLLQLSVSCEKEILDKKPLDIISDAQVWNDPALIQAYVTNLYNRAQMEGIFRGWYWGSPYFGSPVDELIYSDESRLAWDWGPKDWQKGIVNGGNNSMAYWDYNYIRACNEFLILIEGGSVSDEIKKQTKAEVRFLRAYAYFEMAKRYGGVPLVITPQKQSDGEALFVPRNTEQEVYDFIGNECDAIKVDLLEAQPADKTGRATRYAALALKSRAMLYAASIAKYSSVQINGIVGIPADKAATYFQKSYDASKEIIASGKFQLFNKYADKVKNYQMLFIEKNHQEVILAKKYVSVTQGHSIDFYCVPESYKTDWGNMVNATVELVNSFEMVDGSSGVFDFATITGDVKTIFKKKDPRFHAAIFYNGQPWQGDTVRMVWGTRTGGVVTEAPGKDAKGGDVKTGFTMKKFLDENRKRPKEGESDQDWLVFRYGEILLNYAEAAFELSKTNDAKWGVNQIRERAGILPLETVTLQNVRHERQIELVFETHRFWDLRRWRTSQQILTGSFHSAFAYFDTDLKTYYFRVANADGFDRIFKPQHYYMPITESRINNNPKLVENPGY